MAGLVPAIHVLLCCDTKEDVDARHKAGHDEFNLLPVGFPHLRLDLGHA
jgi:hypothetical protein